MKVWAILCSLDRKKLHLGTTGSTCRCTYSGYTRASLIRARTANARTAVATRVLRSGPTQIHPRLETVGGKQVLISWTIAAIMKKRARPYAAHKNASSSHKSVSMNESESESDIFSDGLVFNYLNNLYVQVHSS